jgi:hypothetical protein
MSGRTTLPSKTKRVQTKPVSIRKRANKTTAVKRHGVMYRVFHLLHLPISWTTILIEVFLICAPLHSTTILPPNEKSIILIKV